MVTILRFGVGIMSTIATLIAGLFGASVHVTKESGVLRQRLGYEKNVLRTDRRHPYTPRPTCVETSKNRLARIASWSRPRQRSLPSREVCSGVS